jgi:hypothetical protein
VRPAAQAGERRASLGEVRAAGACTRESVPRAPPLAAACGTTCTACAPALVKGC